MYIYGDKHYTKRISKHLLMLDESDLFLTRLMETFGWLNKNTKLQSESNRRVTLFRHEKAQVQDVKGISKTKKKKRPTLC